MKINLCPFFCALWAVPVVAGAVQPVSKISAEVPIEFKLTKEFCQKLIVDDKQRSDVAYHGGGDVKGNPVVSADLNAFQVDIPEKIRIPITLKKQFVLETKSTGMTTSSGVVKSYIDSVLKSEGVATTAADYQRLDFFVRSLPAQEDTPLSDLTMEQLTQLSDILYQATTSTGSVAGKIDGTVQSKGTIEQSGTAKFKPSGALKSPYVDEIPLGFIEYELKSGLMIYNGKRISSKEESLLRQKCQSVLEGK